MPRVLIIEDDPALRDFFVFDFESLGFQTFAASDGNEALRILKEQAVDAVVSDVLVPGVSGLDIVRALRGGASDPLRPAIVLITGDQETSPDEAYAMGVNAFLYKPFSRHDLSQLVRRHLIPFPERWVSESSDLAALATPKSGDFEIQIDRWKTSAQEPAVTFGWGGLFVPMTDEFPDQNTRVEFQIVSDRSEEGLLTGGAEVRWVRRLAHSGLPSGIGLEILTLNSDGAERLYHFLKKNRPTSYIPLSQFR